MDKAEGASDASGCVCLLDLQLSRLANAQTTMISGCSLNNNCPGVLKYSYVDVITWPTYPENTSSQEMTRAAEDGIQ